jgi:hypothetical protein
MAKFNLTVNGFFWTSKVEPTVVKQDYSEMLQAYVHEINTDRDMSQHIPKKKSLSWTQLELVQI